MNEMIELLKAVHVMSPDLVKVYFQPLLQNQAMLYKELTEVRERLDHATISLNHLRELVAQMVKAEGRTNGTPAPARPQPDLRHHGNMGRGEVDAVFTGEQEERLGTEADPLAGTRRKQ